MAHGRTPAALGPDRRRLQVTGLLRAWRVAGAVDDV
jgi:hypothetical protein